jgi:hypothetical protein
MNRLSVEVLYKGERVYTVARVTGFLLPGVLILSEERHIPDYWDVLRWARNYVRVCINENIGPTPPLSEVSLKIKG